MEAQEVGSQAYLSVATNAPEATVTLDSTRLGTADRSVWPIPPGEHRVQVAPSGPYSWSFESKSVVIEPSAGDTVELGIDFPYVYSINSTPPGASVVHLNAYDQEELGVTPLTHTTDEPLEGMLVIDKHEFDSLHVAPGDELWNSHRVTLVGKGQSGAERRVALPTRRRERQWITYAAAGLGVTAGAAAVYFRRRANKLDSSDDPHVRLRSDKFEHLSNGSLVLMQVGVGVFAVRLVLDN